MCHRVWLIGVSMAKWFEYTSREFDSQKSQWWYQKRASRVPTRSSPCLTRELTPRPRTGINNAEYKLISVPLMIILIAVYIGYVEITPRPVQGLIMWSINGSTEIRIELGLFCDSGQLSETQTLNFCQHWKHVLEISTIRNSGFKFQTFVILFKVLF